MFILYVVYVVVTLLAAAANVFAATLDFARLQAILLDAARAGGPGLRVAVLGTLKAAGALGLIAGIGTPRIGTAAAAGLALFFAGAVVKERRAREDSAGRPSGYLLLAAASFGLRLATL